MPNTKKRRTTATRRSQSVTRSPKRRTTRQRRSTSIRRFERRIFGLKLWHLGGLTLLIAGAALALFIAAVQPAHTSSADTGCTVSATLVNSCRPWLGATATDYTNAASDPISQILYHETRIGRQLDVVHTYHSPGHNALTSTDSYFATRANTMLFANWKPGNTGDSWAKIASGADDGEINTMANSVKALGSAKIFMSIWHEPENDVSSGGDPNCTNLVYKGNEGSVADYQDMWHHVRAVFNADGVTNVVWAVDYMNYAPWNCLLPDLYPGNSYVDWIVFNAYQTGPGGTFEGNISRFEDTLNSDGIGTTKPLGIVEWGADKGTNQTTAQSLASEEAYYTSAKTALDNNDATMAKVKLYMVFDENDQGSLGCTAVNLRVGYDDDCNVNNAKQAAYNGFADDPRLTNAFYAPAPDTKAPTVSLTSPGSGATVSGTISVTGSASDNVGVTSVSLYVDGSKVATDSTSPYSFSVNTASYSDASHSLQLKASDAAGNVGSSAAVSVNVKNQTSSSGGSGTGSTGSGGSSSGSSTPSSNPEATTMLSANTTSSTPVAVKGNLVIAATGGTPVNVSVDGKTISGDSINTTKLTNGTHTVTINENGKAVQQKIVVHNPWPTAVANEVEANKAAYTTGTGTGVLLVFAAVYLFRRKISFWLLRHIRMQYIGRFGLAKVLRFGIKR